LHRLTPRRLTCLHSATTLSILYQRGLYPPESFERKNAHGISVLVSTHPGLRDYLAVILRQLGGERPSSPEQVVHARLAFLVCVLSQCVLPANLLTDWLLEGTLQRLVLVVASVASGEVLERWVFNVDTDKETYVLTPCLTCSHCSLRAL